MNSTPIQTGFYRYTDIFFEWHQIISSPAERSALKAFISNNALAHPENPLRKRDMVGIELYMGIMSSGQARLLFSSAQVEYIRYWLHRMALTKNLLPLPSSDYLLTDALIRNLSPVIYKDASELKNAMKAIEKNNKRLRGTNSQMMSSRQTFERLRTFWIDKAGVWLAIDFEAWEMEHTVITEFGWCAITWEEGKEVQRQGHLILSDNMKYHNGKYVPDNREKYIFGTSETVGNDAFSQRIHDLIARCIDKGPLFLVFHDNSQDIKFLRTVGAPIHNLSILLPDATPTDGSYVADTSDMFAALEGDNSTHRSMESNDAYYTMMAMRSMASGNQLDAQREERWPNRTNADSNLKVLFKPWENDSDFSDTEGLISMFCVDSDKVLKNEDDCKA